MPSARNRCIHYMLGSLTRHCGEKVRRLGHLLPTPMRTLRVVKNNYQGGLLGQLARRTLNVPMCTNPMRTATVNGVLIRTLTGNRVTSHERVGKVVWGQVVL